MNKIKSFRNISAALFTGLLLLGIIVCSICDVAISSTFSWSLYPITAIIFVWFVFVPLVKYGSKGILGSLFFFSILIIPFLYVMSIIVENHLIMSIGIRMSLYSIVYLWCVFFIFGKLKRRKIIAAAISLLLTLPLCVMINISLAKILSVSVFDKWDLLSFAIVAMISIALFIIDYCRMHNVTDKLKGEKE